MSPRTQRAKPLRIQPPHGAVVRTGRELPGRETPRVAVLWCPDWPVLAAIRDAGLDLDAPVALIDKNVVHASSASAREENVTRGLRLREAQARHPRLVDLPYDPAVDLRVFEPVIAAIEELTPAVQVLRPGLCAVRSRGIARYYGSEKAAGIAIAGRMAEVGAIGTRVGIADGVFAAEQAARRTGSETVRVVAKGASAEFLAPLPVGLLGEPALVMLLRRLGIHTLGAFAALPAADVRTRFGDPGARLHALAGGRDDTEHAARIPPPDLDVVVDFEPSLDRVDQVAFGVRTTAESLIDGLTAAKLVATAIRVELHTDSGGFHERVWLHPRSFTPMDVVDRVRWQLEGAQRGGTANGLTSGVARVRIAPESVDAIGNHETGLWGTGPDERVHHALSRVQSMLGHGAVLTAEIGGGRTLADRQRLIAWGDRSPAGRPAAQPWPGRLPAPLPGTVFSPRRPVHVTDAHGNPVTVDARGRVSAAPAAFSADGTDRRILTAWAGPWQLDERWWSPGGANRAHRFQAVDDTGNAWLLALDDAGWWAEARYD